MNNGKIVLDSRTIDSVLFKDCNPDDVQKILKHSGYYFKLFSKNEEIYKTGIINHAGIILSGVVDIIQISPYGREELVVRETAGNLIGQSFCMTGQRNDFIHYRASVETEILFIDLVRIIASPNQEIYYTKFLNNLVMMLSNSNIELNRKIRLLTQKTLREKLLLFFREMARDSKDGKSFVLRFTREQLAQYVFSERTSVCRELGHMQDDGLIKIAGRRIFLTADS